MRRFIPLFLVLGAVVAIGALATRRRQARARPAGEDWEHPTRDEIFNAEAVARVAENAGIAEVDPELMTEISGEGIDLDAYEETQAQLREDRERFPRPPLAPR